MLAPVVRGRKGEYQRLVDELAGQGYTRARVDGELLDLPAKLKLERYEKHTIEVVVDRLVRRSGIERRLTDSLETALKLAEGVAEVEIVPKEGEGQSETLTFSEHLACTHCGLSFEELAPRNFSFNSPYGACDTCDGLGTRFQVDPELLIADEDLSIDDGAIAPWSGFRGEYFKRVLASRRRRVRLLGRHAVEEAEGRAEEGRALRQRAARASRSGTRIGTGVSGQYTTKYEGVVPVGRAPAHGVGVRSGARGHRGLHAARAVPGVQVARG